MPNNAIRHKNGELSERLVPSSRLQCAAAAGSIRDNVVQLVQGRHASRPDVATRKAMLEERVASSTLELQQTKARDKEIQKARARTPEHDFEVVLPRQMEWGKCIRLVLTSLAAFVAILAEIKTGMFTVEQNLMLKGHLTTEKAFCLAYIASIALAFFLKLLVDVLKNEEHKDRLVVGMLVFGIIVALVGTPLFAIFYAGGVVSPGEVIRGEVGLSVPFWTVITVAMLSSSFLNAGVWVTMRSIFKTRLVPNALYEALHEQRTKLETRLRVLTGRLAKYTVLLQQLEAQAEAFLQDRMIDFDAEVLVLKEMQEKEQTRQALVDQVASLREEAALANAKASQVARRLNESGADIDLELTPCSSCRLQPRA